MVPTMDRMNPRMKHETESVGGRLEIAEPAARMMSSLPENLRDRPGLRLGCFRCIHHEKVAVNVARTRSAR